MSDVLAPLLLEAFSFLFSAPQQLLKNTILSLIISSFMSLIPSLCNVKAIFLSEFVFSPLIQYFSDLVLYNGSSIYQYLSNNKASSSRQKHFILGVVFPSFTGRPRGFFCQYFDLINSSASLVLALSTSSSLSRRISCSTMQTCSDNASKLCNP